GPRAGRPQHRGDHVLDGRLAVRARDRDERQLEESAPVLREPAERRPRVVDDDEWPPTAGRRHGGARHDGPGSPGRKRLVEKPDLVEALALDAEKELAGAERARIGRHTDEGAIVAVERASHRGRSFTQT